MQAILPHWFIICHCYGWFTVSNIFWCIELEQLPKKSTKKNVMRTISFVWNGIIFQKMGLYNYDLVYYNTFVILASFLWLFSPHFYL
jgi:ABC-type transport system involved in Fe-S cluster assembly fused permease/ATPase subunit